MKDEEWLKFVLKRHITWGLESAVILREFL